MIITIIAEPRSGSTNLANWFYNNKSFTTLFEPSDSNSNWYQRDKSPKQYKFTTKNLCIKEIYYPNKNFEELTIISDKIICLYRENYKEQLESFLNSVITNNWHRPYVYTEKTGKIINEKTEYFKILKTEFKEKYLNYNFFNISYENLYYADGIKSVIKYIGDDELKDFEFPVGEKYRKPNNDKKTLI